MSELPKVEQQFQNAKNAALKQIASGRITRTQIFFNFQNLKKLGVHNDLREKIYQEIEKLSLEELTEFYNSKIKNLHFNTAIIGKRENLNMKAVEKMGTFVELSLEEIFGY